MRSLLPILLMFVALQSAHSLKILGVFPFPGYSHYYLGASLFKELAARGHDVTMLASFEEKDAVGKYKTILLDGFVEDMAEMSKEINFFDQKSQSTITSFVFFGYMGNKLSRMTFEHPKTKELIASNEEFDVVIVEQFISESTKGFCHRFNAPCVVFSSVSTTYWTNILVGNPGNPSYVPEMFLNHVGPMSFFHRVQNTWINLVHQIFYMCYLVPSQDAILHEYFPYAPPLINVMQNASLILLNSHVTTSQPVPLMPNMIEIGGFHIRPPKELPKDLKSYLDNAKGGVVYFSMGSNLKSKNMSLEKREAILKAFAKLNMQVLWKFEDQNLPGKPDNVRIEKWLPQSDILAHPNVKLFITHGGLLSTIEAIYHGKPLIGIPIYGDQGTNMEQVASYGFAIPIDYTTLTEEDLTAALNEILNKPRYAIAAKKHSASLHDQPIKPLDKAIFWVEYVARHNGAYHFRSAALDLAWYQYFLLDVIAFGLLVTFVILAAIILIVKKLFGKSGKQSKKLKKN